MKKLYLFNMISLGILLCGCSQLSTTEPSMVQTDSQMQVLNRSTQLKKSPITVSLYNSKTEVHKPYVILGKEVVPKYNSGIKRQMANIRDSLRTLAASMGGDAIMDIQHDKKSISATVIAYEA